MDAGLSLVTSLPVFVWLCIWKGLDCDLFPTRPCFQFWKREKSKTQQSLWSKESEEGGKKSLLIICSHEWEMAFEV